MNDEDIEILDAFEEEKDKTKEYNPIEDKVESKREAHRRTKINRELEEETEKEEKNKKENKKKDKKNKKNKKEEIKEEVKEDSNGTKKVTVRKFKTGLFIRFIFCLLSYAFIIGCFIFYGGRLIKYYNIYNPKDASGKTLSLLNNKITSGSTFVYSGSGLYLSSGNYVFKGDVSNNYVSYSNMLWRIIKINEDKTIDIVLDKPINTLKWNKEISSYNESDINSYLKEEFLPLLEKEVLVNTDICTDIIDDVNSISCKDIDTSNLIRLLSIEDFLNSKVDEKSYLADGESIWLTTRGKDKVWAINNLSLSFADSNETYEVKPAVRLKNSTALIKGEGTKEKPYVITNESKLALGKQVKLDKDIYTIYKIEKDKLCLTSTKNITKQYQFDTKTNIYTPTSRTSLAYYLNNTYYNGLSYKDKLLETTWYTGTYEGSYKDIKNSEVKAKIGLPSIIDFKYDSAEYYYLLNGTKKRSYLYKNGLIEASSSVYHSIKPSICIKKTNVKSGNGTVDNPFVLED